MTMLLGNFLKINQSSEATCHQIKTNLPPVFRQIFEDGISEIPEIKLKCAQELNEVSPVTEFQVDGSKESSS